MGKLRSQKIMICFWPHQFPTPIPALFLVSPSQGAGQICWSYSGVVHRAKSMLLVRKSSSQDPRLRSILLCFIQWTQFIFFIITSIFIHQFLVQFIEFFKLNRFFEILFNVIVTSVISFVFILAYTLAFKIKQKV